MSASVSLQIFCLLKLTDQLGSDQEKLSTELVALVIKSNYEKSFEKVDAELNHVRYKEKIFEVARNISGKLKIKKEEEEGEKLARELTVTKEKLVLIKNIGVLLNQLFTNTHINLKESFEVLAKYFPAKSGGDPNYNGQTIFGRLWNDIKLIMDVYKETESKIPTLDFFIKVQKIIAFYVTPELVTLYVSSPKAVLYEITEYDPGKLEKNQISFKKRHENYIERSKNETYKLDCNFVFIETLFSVVNVDGVNEGGFLSYIENKFYFVCIHFALYIVFVVHKPSHADYVKQYVIDTLVRNLKQKPRKYEDEKIQDIKKFAKILFNFHKLEGFVFGQSSSTSYLLLSKSLSSTIFKNSDFVENFFLEHLRAGRIKVFLRRKFFNKIIKYCLTYSKQELPGGVGKPMVKPQITESYLLDIVKYIHHIHGTPTGDNHSEEVEATLKSLIVVTQKEKIGDVKRKRKRVRPSEDEVRKFVGKEKEEKTPKSEFFLLPTLQIEEEEDEGEE